MHINRRLLRTPRAHCDESLKGLKLSATEENGYDSPWLLALADLKEDCRTKTNLYTDQRWENVSEMLNLPIPTLQDLACLAGIEETPPKHFNMFGHVISKYSVRISKPKICPGCLRHSNYIRKIWDLAAFTCCPEHGTLLIDECPTCGQNISWGRGKVSVCPCGQDWRELDMILPRLIWNVCGLSKLEEPSVDLSCGDTAGQGHANSHPLSTVSLAELLASVYFVAGLQHGVVDTTGKQYAVKLSHKELHADLTKAIAVFEDWPNNYYKFIEDCRGNISIGSCQSGVYKDFGRLYDPLFVRKNNPLPNVMREEFQEYITKHWDGGYAGKCSNISEEHLSKKTYMTKHEVTKYLQVGVKTVMLLHKEGFLKGPLYPWVDRSRIMIEADSVRELKAKWDTSITAAQAGEILGIGRIAVVSLVKSKCLAAIQGPTVTKQLEWKFEVVEVERLLRSLEGKIVEGEHRFQEQNINFHKAIQKLSKLSIEVGAFVKLILDGKITMVAKGDGAGLASLMFDAGEIEQFSRTKAVELREGRHTLEETAKLLRTSNDETTFLVKQGLLIAEKACSGRGGTWSITREEIERFNATYCTVGMLVDAFCTSTKGLSDRLMDNGIVPVTGPKIDGGVIYFFKRVDLEAVDSAVVLPKTKDKTCQKMNEQGLVSTRQLADMTGLAIEQIKETVRKGEIIPAITHRPEKGRNSWFFSQEQVEQVKRMKSIREGQLGLFNMA
jgi:hypothetical protein